MKKITRAQIKSTIKRHAPGIIIGSVVTATVIVCHYKRKELLEITPEMMKFLKDSGDAILFRNDNHSEILSIALFEFKK